MSKTTIPRGGITADAIDGTLIADDAINSEHYTDGSIDTAHIGDNQVTAAKATGVGGLVHLNTITITSSTADATFLHGTNGVVLNDGTYENFLIIGSGIKVSNDDDQIRVSFSKDAGSNYNSQTYRATDHIEMTEGGSSGSASTDGQSSAGASAFMGAVGNNLGNTAAFTMYLFNANGTNNKKNVLIEALEEQHNTIYKKRSSMIAIAERVDAIDGIRFNCNAGTFSTATFRLYGITNG